MGNKTILKSNIFYLVLVSMYLAFNFILNLVSNKFGSNFIDDNVNSILLFIQIVILLIPSLIYIYFIEKKPKEILKFNSLKFKTIILVILMSVCACFIGTFLNNIVIFLLQRLGEVPFDNIVMASNKKELIISIFVVALSPAICEEIFNRGILLHGYKNTGRIKAIAFTGFMFGIFHFDIRNLVGPIFLGILIAYYVIRTNSLFAGMIAHFTNNFISVILSYIGNKYVGNETVRLNLEALKQLFYLSLFFLLGFVIFLYLFNLFTKNDCEQSEKLLEEEYTIKKVTLRELWPVLIVIVLYIIITSMMVSNIMFGVS